MTYTSVLQSPDSRARKAAQSLAIAFCLVAAGLSGCSKKVKVPDVTQLPLDQARQTLSAAKLTPGKVTCSQGDVLPEAKVLSQSPSAGESAAVNTAVDLIVEPGVLVPSLIDNNASDALITLQNVGLKASLKKQSTLDVFHAGKVLAQDVPAGTAATRNSVVTLTVATPPDVSAFAALITQQPAYQRLSPQQRSMLDDLLK